MEIKGDDFLKRIQVQQERDELEQKLNELEEVETSINSAAQQKPKQEIPQAEDQELGNIMLENSSNEENKKKYLVLGLVLVVLFLLTIIIIRLLTDSSKEDPFTADKTQSLEVAKTQEENNIEENFQKIMNDRVKKNNEVKNEEIISEEKLNALKPKVVEPKEEAISNDDLDETIKKIEEKKKEIVKKPEPKKVVKKEEPKSVVKKEEPKRSIKDLVQSSSSSAPKGYFVQIGAFTKTPSNSYINKIRNAGLKYKIYKVEVKGKLYNKVLIGPYSSRATAKQNIDNIKKKMNISSAYVLKF